MSEQLELPEFITVGNISRVDRGSSTEFGIPHDTPAYWLKRSFVTVYHPQDPIFRDREPKPAAINWSAIGSQTPETAELFVEAMSQAIQLAKELNSKQGTEN